MERQKYTEEQVAVLKMTPIAYIMEIEGFPIRNNKKLYVSPFREDDIPSMEITSTPTGDLWHDFGDTDKEHYKRTKNGGYALNRHGSPYVGGDVFDFVALLLRTRGQGHTYNDCLNYLASFNPNIVPEIQSSSPRRNIRKNVSKTVKDYGKTNLNDITFDGSVTEISWQKGANPLLSNFSSVDIPYNGKIFKSAEQLFQWLKATLAGNTDTARDIHSASTPEEARRLGQTVAIDQKTWSEKAPGIMEMVLRLKFRVSNQCRAELIKTGKSRFSMDDEAERPGWKTLLPALLAKLRDEYAKELVNENGMYAGESEKTILEQSKGLDKLSDNKLLGYFTDKRGITRQCLDRYAYCVKYTVKNDEKTFGPFCAIGNPTVDGEWNLRTAPYTGKDGEEKPGKKISTGQGPTILDPDGNYMINKTGTRLSGEGVFPSSETVWVFEGFADFLSWLVWNEKTVPGADVVILNSVNNLAHAKEFIKEHSKVFLCLDNDKAGHNATVEIARECCMEDRYVYDMRPTFIGKEKRLQYFFKDSVLSCMTGPVEDYWKERLGKGPNDVNDAWLSSEKYKNAKTPVKGNVRTPVTDARKEGTRSVGEGMVKKGTANPTAGNTHSIHRK